MEEKSIDQLFSSRQQKLEAIAETLEDQIIPLLVDPIAELVQRCPQPWMQIRLCLVELQDVCAIKADDLEDLAGRAARGQQWENLVSLLELCREISECAARRNVKPGLALAGSLRALPELGTGSHPVPVIKGILRQISREATDQAEPFSALATAAQELVSMIDRFGPRG